VQAIVASIDRNHQPVRIGQGSPIVGDTVVLEDLVWLVGFGGQHAESDAIQDDDRADVGAVRDRAGGVKATSQIRQHCPEYSGAALSIRRAGAQAHPVLFAK
jgi:hypothetical protein